MMDTVHDPARVLVIERLIAAPARLLFDTYSKPEHLMRWFGPTGYPLTLCEVDFRVGGRFRMAMTGPDGQQNTPFGGRYVDIVPDAKIVYTNSFELPDAEEMVTTVTFVEEGAKTRLTMHTLFASAAMKSEYVKLGFEEGVNIGFDQLEALAAALLGGGS